MVDFEGETAVVTGAAQGFGRRIAERFSENGSNVVIVDIQTDKAHEVADGIEKDRGEVEVIDCDVTDIAAVESMVEQIEDRFGTIEILVNNAGGSGSETFTEIDPAAWKDGLALNLTAPFHCSHAVVPGMIEHGKGRIVNISSMAGRNVTLNGNPSYTAGKWGVIGLSKHMARDLGPEVRVNTVCPGGGPDSPVGRGMTADDVADAVLYLSSDLSAFIHGTILEVDGGGHLNPSAAELAERNS